MTIKLLLLLLAECLCFFASGLLLGRKLWHRPTPRRCVKCGRFRSEVHACP